MVSKGQLCSAVLSPERQLKIFAVGNIYIPGSDKIDNVFVLRGRLVSLIS